MLAAKLLQQKRR